MSRSVFSLLVLASACTTASAEPRPRAIDPLAAEREAAATDPSRLPHESDDGLALGAARFSAEGAAIPAGGGTVHIALHAYGRDGALTAAHDAEPTAVGPEVRIARGPGVTEWWRSLPSGLEQGVTVDERPAGDGPLILEMSVGDGVLPETASDDAITLRDASGASLGSYAGLVVIDADGAAVPARMAAAGERIRIEIDDAGARYPLTVDPLVITPEAVPLPSLGGTRLGASVTISADGSRAIVGASSGAQVFLRAGATWTREATLPSCGSVVALSADGARAFCGGGNSTGGTVTVIVRSGTTWAVESTVSFTFAIGASPGGVSSVAVSADGMRLAVGTAGEILDLSMGTEGSLRVFTRVGTTWTLEAALFAADATQLDRLGTTVAIADNGSRLVAGGGCPTVGGAGRRACGRMFVRSGTTWTEEAQLRMPEVSPLGLGVALSGDGSRAVVSGSVVSRVDAVVFVRTGATWAVERMLPESRSAGSSARTVSLGSAGTRLLVGTTQARTVPSCSGSCRFDGAVDVFQRAGTTWTLVSTLLAPTPGSGTMAGGEFGAAVAISADGRRMIVGEPVGADGPRAHAYSLRDLGDPCSAGSECPTALCVDGVCCDAACGGGATDDCEACSVAAGGAANGTCGGLTAIAAPAVTCRPSAGLCDVAEVCVAGLVACPADARASSSTVCRPPATACDAEENCDGTSVACPTNQPALRDTPCRPAAGPCDFVERCDGSSYLCAADSFIAAGTTCGGTAGACTTAGVCSGGSPLCGGGTPLPAATVCLPADASNPCDVADHCDGVLGVCVPAFAAAAVECAPSTGEVCDAPDHCSGTSGDCVAEFLDGVVCRPPAGSCDVAETCSGDSASCPGDSFLASGIVCNPSSEACDPAEVCDGAGATCPANVTCAVDGGGVDGGGAIDAASAADTGPVPTATAGCACRAGTGAAIPFGSGVGVMLALVIARTRRRTQTSPSFARRLSPTS